MRRTCVALTLLALSITLASCGKSNHATTMAVRKMTVSGTTASVERFVKLQKSAPIPLAASSVTSLDKGRAEATVTIPANFDGRSLVHTTREALAAGLSYRYEEVHFVSTVTT